MFLNQTMSFCFALLKYLERMHVTKNLLIFLLVENQVLLATNWPGIFFLNPLLYLLQLRSDAD